MYITPRTTQTTIDRNISVEGEMLEQKVERIINNKEPIKDGAPILYIDRKEGVRSSTNIRTDRWEIAIEATEAIAKSYKAKREERHKPKTTEEPKTDTDKDGKAKPIGGNELRVVGNQ